LLYHTIDLETFSDGVGPHTISFPRVTSASGDFDNNNLEYLVSDEDFKKLVTIIRLSVPHTGLIITARESAKMRKEIIPLGCTQTDASTKIGVGAYSENYSEQEKERQQFMLGDTRDLQQVIQEFAESGYITSFCTAGYRCGRTGDKIMDLLKCGTEGKFCKLNAVLTFREWLDDFANDDTKKTGETIIQKELNEINNDPFFQNKKLLEIFRDYYERVKNGERDLFL
jgi:2-iminoacetate synthase